MINLLASMPRSGSSLLTCLLNQRPVTHASTTSGLANLLQSTSDLWENNESIKATIFDGDVKTKVLANIINTYYKSQKDQVIIDNGRLWALPKMIDLMERVQGETKIIATVRPPVECAASFVQLRKPNDIYDFCTNDPMMHHLKWGYETLSQGYAYKPEAFHIIHYHDLVNNTQEVMDGISNYLGIEKYTHDLNNIPTFLENSNAYGDIGKDLHNVGKVVKQNLFDSKEILTDWFFNEYSRWPFTFKGGD